MIENRVALRLSDADRLRLNTIAAATGNQGITECLRFAIEAGARSAKLKMKTQRAKVHADDEPGPAI